jgi:hypothetical protein
MSSVNQAQADADDDLTQPALYVLAKPAIGAAAIDPYTGITPGIIAVIQTAATAFLGKRIRIVSVKLASASQENSNSWAGQGRDIIHTSHNLVQRGR